MADQASRSYVSALPVRRRDPLLAELRGIVESRYPHGTMTVPYETWLWTATRA